MKALIKSLWWLLLFATTWSSLLLTVNRREFKAFFTGGLWSVGLAALGESLIRRHVTYFTPDYLLLPVLGTDFLNFIGPRFVEGVIFMKTMKPRRELLRTGVWIAGIVLSEMGLSLTGYVSLSWRGVGLALAVHTLRFLSLLGIYYSIGYHRTQLYLQAEAERVQAARATLDITRALWPFSWAAFWAGAGVFAKAARIFTRLPLFGRRKP